MYTTVTGGLNGTYQEGRSGLRIDAQRQALAQFDQAESFEIAKEFVEVETGAEALNARGIATAWVDGGTPRVSRTP